MDWIWVVVLALRSGSTSPDDRWAVVLAELDRVRAVAFAEADPSRLDEVYLRGSRARTTDAATISDYSLRGGRVVNAELRVLTCHVVSATGHRVQLDVVDRLGRARVEWPDGSTTELPRDTATRRTIILQRTDQGWRIADSDERRGQR